MEFPPNPTPSVRVAILAPAASVVLLLGWFQPVIIIAANTLPPEWNDILWRVKFFALVLGSAPQIAVQLAVIAVVAMYFEKYRVVRFAAVAAFVIALLLVPILLFDALDLLQARHIVPQSVLTKFEVDGLQTGALAALMLPLLFWLGYRGWHASKQLPKLGAAAALLIDEEPAPGPLDPRVTN